MFDPGAARNVIIHVQGVTIMSAVFDYLRRIGALKSSLPNDESARTWLADPDRVVPTSGTGRQDAAVSAVFKRMAGGERRDYVADIVELIDDSAFNAWMVIGTHRTWPPHDAFFEQLGIGLRKNLPSGSYEVGEAVVDPAVTIGYSLYFRNPPYFPEGDITVSFDVVSGKLVLQNNGEQGVISGEFRNVLVRIHKTDDLIGTGPDAPYEMIMLDGSFRAQL